MALSISRQGRKRNESGAAGYPDTPQHAQSILLKESKSLAVGFPAPSTQEELPSSDPYTGRNQSVSALNNFGSLKQGSVLERSILDQ